MNNYFENVSELLLRWREIDDDINLKITWDGEYANQVYSEICIFNFVEEKKQILENTISYISENFEKIYLNMLNAILPIVKEWGMKNRKTGKDVLSINDLDAAKLEQDFIESIQINCADVKNDKAYYSIIFRINYFDYGYDDGMEVVFYEDKVVFWSDGNTGEYLFEFREHEDEVAYFDE